MEEVKMIFTNRELQLLSDGIISLIHNASEATKLLNDTMILTLVQDHINELQELNKRICEKLK